MNITNTIKFNSIYELGLASQVNLTKDNHAPTGGAIGGDTNMSMTQAVNSALQGGYYPEGARQLQDAAAQMPETDVSVALISKTIHAEHGFRPNVPAYLSNEPQNMYNVAPTDKPNRLIKIAVHVGKEYSIEAKQTFNRGRAIMAVIDSLTASGYNVELTAIWRNQTHSGDTLSIETIIKHSDDSYSPDSIAFALCNEAFQRRLYWLALETHDSSTARVLTGNGYGHGAKAQYPEYDLHYGFMRDHRHWNNPEQALKHIVDDTRAQLNKPLQAAA